MPLSNQDGNGRRRMSFTVCGITDDGAVRDVALAPALGRMLRAHRLASRHSGDGDFVFVNEAGRPFNARNVQARGFDRAARIAGLDEGAERVATFHDLRRTFGSLIAAGADVVHVSKQLGHADPAITLRVYGRVRRSRQRRPNSERARRCNRRLALG